MALSVASGTFVRITTVASQSVSGLAFQPRAVLMWFSGGLTDATFTTNSYQTIGAFAGIGTAPVTPTQASCGNFQGATTTMQTGHRIAAKALVISSNTGTLVAECDATINAGGFSLNWTTNGGVAQIVNWIAFGGTDITGAFVKTFTAPSVATNPFAVTGVGFQPDVIMLAGSRLPGASLPAGGDHHHFQFGAATSAGSWAFSGFSLDGLADNHSARVQNSGVVLQTATASSATPTSVASISETAALVSMDADGFTLNYSVATAAWWKFALCLKGGSFAVNVQNKTTGASGSADTISGLTFTPTGLILGSFMRVSSTAAEIHDRNSLGFSDGTNENTGYHSHHDNVATSAPRTVSKAGKVLVLNDADTSVIAAETDVTLNAAGFTATWSTNNAVATQYAYLAVGNAAAGGPFPPWPQRIFRRTA